MYCIYDDLSHRIVHQERDADKTTNFLDKLYYSLLLNDYPTIIGIE